VEKDASSGSSYALATGGGLDAADRGPQLSASDLTHELAQLLAASIARQQADKALGVPTNAGLTSLASLVSAVSAQRTLPPQTKDGLSALSYSRRSDRTPVVPESAAAEAASDDEPMPIPSTWRQPAYDDDRSYRQQMGAALLGLAAGLIIVVPTVLWMSGWFEARKANPTALPRVAAAAIEPKVAAAAIEPKAAAAAIEPKAAAAAIEPKVAEVRTMKVQVHPVEKEKPVEAAAQYMTGNVAPRTVVEAVPSVPAQPTPSALAARFAEPPPAEAQAPPNDLIAQAMRRAESGDVAGARQMLMLESAESDRQGLVSFALAETYDPNMLAAWGSRGVAADVARARALYRKALSLGVASAHGRLEALK